MYTLLFGAVLLFGAIFGFGYLIKWFIEEIIPNFENHNFPSLLAICAGITFAATFLIVFLFWFWTVICFELNDISPLGSGEDFSFIKTVNISVVFMMIALIVLTSIKIRYIYTNNKIILYYCIFAVLVSLIASMFVNIILNNYIWKVFSIIPLLIGILSFVVSVILFTYLNSVDRKNRILREYITRINARIKSAMLIAENFLNENNVDNLNKRKYNKLRKNANKYLTKKSAYKTFQPVFEEDKIVLKTVALFKTLSCKALEDKYKQYKLYSIPYNHGTEISLRGWMNFDENMESMAVLKWEMTDHTITTDTLLIKGKVIKHEKGKRPFYDKNGEIHYIEGEYQLIDEVFVNGQKLWDLDKDGVLIDYSQYQTAEQITNSDILKETPYITLVK